MAVIWFKEIARDEGAFSGDGQRDYTRRFVALANTRHENPNTLRAYAGTPKLWTTHPADQFAFCQEVTPSRKSSFLWDIVADYSSRIDEQDRERLKNPLARAAKIETQATEYTERVLEDRHGEPTLNTAGDFLQGIPRYFSRFKIQVEKNFATIPRFAVDYQNAINDGAVRVRGFPYPFPKYSLRFVLQAISDLQREDGTPFYTIRFLLDHHPRTWIYRTPNVGFRELIEQVRRDPDTGEITRKKVLQEVLINGERPTDPVFLNKEGDRPRDFATGEPLDPIRPQDVHWLRFELYHPKPFSVLPIR